MRDIQWQDVKGSLEGVKEEEIYTLLRNDFLCMPDLDFTAVAHSDPFVRALLN